MLLFNNEFIFKYKWNNVTLSFWNKYPNNYNKNVVATHVIDRYIENNILITNRIIETSFFKYIPYMKQFLISEYSEVNYDLKQMTIISKNITFTNNISVEEHITFKTNDIENTIMNQIIKVNAFSFGFIIEKKIMNEIKKNCNLGYETLINILEKS